MISPFAVLAKMKNSIDLIAVVEGALFFDTQSNPMKAFPESNTDDVISGSLYSVCLQVTA
jgi:hypothetical protein